MILLSVPFNKAHKWHIPSLMEWYARNQAKHELVLNWVAWRPLQKALQGAVERARRLGCTHILFTEHDHWGYPIDGLDVLLAHDKDVVGFLTHYKEPPYYPMAYRKKDPSVSMMKRKKNLSVFRPSGLAQCDLITWAFTLVKMSVFDKMLEAGKDPFASWGVVPPDSCFCQYCEDLGIERWVDGSVEIEHGDVPISHIPAMRRAFESILASQRRLNLHDMVELDEEHDIIPYQLELQKEAIQARNVELAPADEVPAHDSVLA